MTRHTLTSYENELRGLEQAIAELGRTVQEQLRQAVDALTRRDIPLAEAVITADRRVDRLQRDVEHTCIRIFALRQPAADDLRLVMVAVKASHELERIGDYAKNIAKRTPAVAQQPAMEIVAAIPPLADLAAETLGQALIAFAQRDDALARETWSQDEKLDEHYTAVYRRFLAHMIQYPDDIPACTHLMFIAKNIERIGDHATNIAEMVCFLVSGEEVGDDRPKADLSSEVVKGE